MKNKKISDKIELFRLYKAGALTKDEYEFIKSRLIENSLPVEDHENLQKQISENNNISEPKTIEPLQENEPRIESKKNGEKVNRKNAVLFFLIIGFCALSLVAMLVFLAYKDKPLKEINEPIVESIKSADENSAVTIPDSSSEVTKDEDTEMESDISPSFLLVGKDTISESVLPLPGLYLFKDERGYKKYIQVLVNDGEMTFMAGEDRNNLEVEDVSWVSAGYDEILSVISIGAGWEYHYSGNGIIEEHIHGATSDDDGGGTEYIRIE